MNRVSAELTDAQSRVRDWIATYIANHGYSPSLRDIGAGLGIASPNGVACHLKALERKGAIRRPKTVGPRQGLSRAIYVVPTEEDNAVRDAASDLLAACEAAERYLSSKSGSSPLRQISAAISKAKGLK